MFRLTDHPRGQGSVERLGGWMQDVLSELCVSWPERWDEYGSPAFWIKCTSPDSNLSEYMFPFEILFGRKRQTSLGDLMPQMDGTETSGGLDSFVQQRHQRLQEVHSDLEKAIKTMLQQDRRPIPKSQDFQQEQPRKPEIRFL